jgi:hypothetical protein
MPPPSRLSWVGMAIQVGWAFEMLWALTASQMFPICTSGYVGYHTLSRYLKDCTSLAHNRESRPFHFGLAFYRLVSLSCARDRRGTYKAITFSSNNALASLSLSPSLLLALPHHLIFILGSTSSLQPDGHAPLHPSQPPHAMTRQQRRHTSSRADERRSPPPQLPEHVNSSSSSQPTRRSNVWSTSDDTQLVELRRLGKHWRAISQHFPTKTDNACRKRYERLLQFKNKELGIQDAVAYLVIELYKKSSVVFWEDFAQKAEQLIASEGLPLGACLTGQKAESLVSFFLSFLSRVLEKNDRCIRGTPLPLSLTMKRVVPDPLAITAIPKTQRAIRHPTQQPQQQLGLARRPRQQQLQPRLNIPHRPLAQPQPNPRRDPRSALRPAAAAATPAPAAPTAPAPAPAT